ncbi:MAG: FAD-dependent oxidoreductase [Pseudomonadota bacterium]
MPRTKIAIIGAGMTGLTCASSLTEAGYDVTTFDKGRGPGGRMSTRRVDGGTFDHGAQYMRPETSEFADWLTAQTDNGNTAPCPLTAHDGKQAAFVGTPHMNALPTAIAVDLNVHQSINIAQIQRREGLWQLDADDGLTHGPFDQVVVTIPAPQVAALLGPYAAPFESDLDRVDYNRCMVAMIGFQNPIEAPADLIKPAKGPIGFVARDSARPSRKHSLDCWVVHAKADWSLTHQDDEKASIASDLLSALHDIIPTASNEKPVYLEGHRWRYAIVSKPVGKPFLSDPENALTIAGDYMLGPNVEHAFLSGKKAAAHITANL